MPERKRFNEPGGDLFNMSQTLRTCRDYRSAGKKNGPEIRGHWSKVLVRAACSAKKATASETTHLRGLRGRNRGGLHCATRRGPRSLAHDRWRPSGGQTGRWRARSRWKQSWTLSSPFYAAADRRIRSGDNLRIPDTSHNSFVCIAAIYLLQCNITIGTAH